MINLPLKIYLITSLLCVVSSINALPHASNKLVDSNIVSERIIWDKKPIPLQFRIGQERIIHFPTEIRYWLPDSLKSSVTAMSANGVLYLTAQQSFLKTRIRVQEIETQTVYLLDISSDAEGRYPEEVIILNAENIENKSKGVITQKSKNDWYIRLARFAAQSLYAPERLIPSDNEIVHIEVDSTETVPLVRGGNIKVTPIDSWKGSGFYVTAVLIQNTSANNILIVDDRFNKKVNQLGISNADKERILYLNTDIRGNWLAAIPQHTVLMTAGTDNDKTTLYLISTRSFMESL